MSRRFRLVLSAACCLLAVMLGLSYADDVRKEADRVRQETLARYGGEVVSLAVARIGLEPGDVVSATNVEMREWLADLAPDGAVTDLEEVIGRELSVAAAKGAPLTDINFRDAGQVTDVPSGHMAVAIPVTDKLGVSRSVAVGSALMAYRVTAEGVRLISRDMTVLASPGQVTGMSSSLQLTVAVLPDDVPEVLAASASNDLRLVMPARGESGPESEVSTSDGSPAVLDAGALAGGPRTEGGQDGDAGEDGGPVVSGESGDDEAVGDSG